MVDLEDKRNCMTTWILNISMYLLCLWFAFFWLICVSLTEMWFIDNFGDLISESLTLHFQKFPVHGIFNCMLKRRQPWQTLDNNYNPIIHRYSVHQQVRDDTMTGWPQISPIEIYLLEDQRSVWQVLIVIPSMISRVCLHSLHSTTYLHIYISTYLRSITPHIIRLMSTGKLTWSLS